MFPERLPIADETHTHDVITQRDHPEPSILDKMDRDIPFHARFTSLDMAEMGEDRGRGIMLVGPSLVEAMRQETIATGPIENKPRCKAAHPLLSIDSQNVRTLARWKTGFGHAYSLPRGHAMRRGIAEQYLVEFRAPNLIGMRFPGTDRPSERKRHPPFPAIGDKLGTRLENADLLHLRQYAQIAEQRQVAWQKGFADVEARMMLLFQHHDGIATARQQRRRRAAGRSAANHQNIAQFRCDCLGHAMPPLIPIVCPEI
ncbi:hypothetical protein A0U93_00980 [Neoasaia chiangmaiensis]|uniref:Uncharacterized protein n=1 Tax=Neoasaia chiangmaiensis TaxID=320497 RepID=A0A1U9KLT9_9PROT|nr:hypothetical protein A0U93_00980 [Neoasaia chiangmaiensis]